MKNFTNSVICASSQYSLESLPTSVQIKMSFNPFVNHTIQKLSNN